MIASVASLDDPRIREYRAVADSARVAHAGLFVAEGRWVVERLLAQPRYVTRSVLATSPAVAALTHTVNRDVLARVPIYVVEPRLMNQIAGFDIHRGCLALAERPPVPAFSRELLRGTARVVVLEGVNNPDNVGGIFRSAAAFGVDLVVLGPACGDPLYRKAVRTSMAATLDVPYARSSVWPDALDTLRQEGLRLLALTPAPDGAPIESVPRDGRVALLLGTEGAGLSAPALAKADLRVRIPTTSRVDSLNVVVAASIALHHCAAFD